MKHKYLLSEEEDVPHASDVNPVQGELEQEETSDLSSCAESILYVAFPQHLLNELLAFLPTTERSFYAERFEPVIWSLIWFKEDAEKALQTALVAMAETSELARKVLATSSLQRELVTRIMRSDFDGGIQWVNEALEEAGQIVLEEWMGEQ